MTFIDVTLVIDGVNIAGVICKEKISSYYADGGNVMVEMDNGSVCEVFNMSLVEFKALLSSGWWGLLWS